MATILGEVPTPAPNGSQTIFTLTAAIQAGTSRVYAGGARQLRGAGNDYTESGSTIVFATAPVAGLNLIVDYDT